MRGIIKESQWKVYRESIQQLMSSTQLRNSDQLSRLHAFLDDFGLLIVGGRFEASSLSYDTKHPIIFLCVLRYKIDDLLHQHPHGGPQALLTIARQGFWPIKGKTLVRSIAQDCVRCARVNQKLIAQLMGDPPAHRVQPDRPFTNTSIDFTGPLWIHKAERKVHKNHTLLFLLLCYKVGSPRASNKLNNESIRQCTETFHRTEGTLPKFVLQQCDQLRRRKPSAGRIKGKHIRGTSPRTTNQLLYI